MREPVIDCAHKYQHPPVAQRQIYADIGVQYSATMNVCDLPLRMRTCLIYIVAPHKYDRECDDNFLGMITHCKRNLRSMCLIASRRKPAPPVV